VKVKDVQIHAGSRWELAEIDVNIVEASLADDLREDFVDEDRVLHWETLLCELRRIGEPELVSWFPDPGRRTGTLEMDWSELSYGTYELQGSLLPALQALGLPFFARDDGKYENAGAALEWRPGWEKIAASVYHSSRGKLISESDWRRILEETDSPTDAAQAVSDFFSAPQQSS
jgi:hypothetical protein